MPNRYWFFCAVAVFLVGRLYTGFSSEHHFPVSGDAGHYYQIATNLAENDVYAEHGIIPTTTAIWRAPLWPFVLSAWLECTPNLFFILIIKSIFEILPLVMLYFFLSMADFSGYQLGLLLGLFAIEPQYLKYSCTLLSENLTAWLLAATTASFFLTMVSNSRLAAWCTAVFGGFAILSHPVVLLFVTALTFITAAFRYKNGDRLVASLSVFTFLLIVTVWPLRNHLIFNSGFMMTASQGAVFSKSWNANVVSLHTNTQGDLLDEGLNLQQFPDLKTKANADPLFMSSRYTNATWMFIRSADVAVLSKIALTKLTSALNPFPETAKPGKLEIMGVVFRLFYLIGLVLAIWSLIMKKFNNKALEWWACWVLVIGFSAISLMSILLYTGLRFNSPYGLTFLVLSAVVCLGLINKHKVNSMTLRFDGLEGAKY